MKSGFFFLFIIALLCSSCATNYTYVKPQSINFRNEQTIDSLTFSYKYNIMEIYNNKSYARKEKRRGITIIAANVTNNYAHDILVSRDLDLSTGQHEVIMVNAELAIKELRQNVAPYALYGLIILTEFDCPDSRDPCPRIYPVGLPFAAGNMIVAGVSNDNFRKEFLANDLFDRTIKAGESVTGLLAIEFTNYEPLHLRLK